MKEKIKEILKTFDVEPTEGLVKALEWFIDNEKFDARHDGAMDAIRRIRKRFGLPEEDEK